MSFKRNSSFWEMDAMLRPFDFGVIGSGLTGLGAALEWKRQRPGDRVAVFERGPIPTGASTRNAGFACFGSPTELLDDLQSQPDAAVWKLVEDRWQGLQHLRKLVGDENMDYEGLGGYEIFRAEEEAGFQACMEKLPVFNKELEGITGEKETYQLRDDLIPSFGFKGISHIIENRLEGQLHPGKLLEKLYQMALNAGVLIYTGLEVARMEEESDRILLTSKDGLNLEASRLLLATNGFAGPFLLESEKVLPARNQIILTKAVAGLQLKGCYHYDRGYYYFRNLNGRLLIGGGRHLEKDQEQTADFGLTDNILQPMHRLISEVILPGVAWETEQQWSGIMGVGPQKQPVFRFLSDRTFAAVRLGGMGVALGAKLGAKAAQKLLDS
ncbi:MAG: FAD-binding oxidoreductase [Bacteroidetes bacterium]|nr:FAD-binding oxidoreductase [Bacteroidota bacterium]